MPDRPHLVELDASRKVLPLGQAGFPLETGFDLTVLTCLAQYSMRHESPVSREYRVLAV